MKVSAAGIALLVVVASGQVAFVSVVVAVVALVVLSSEGHSARLRSLIEVWRTGRNSTP